MNKGENKLPNDIHRIINRYLYDGTMKQLIEETLIRKSLINFYDFSNDDEIINWCIRKCQTCKKDSFSISHSYILQPIVSHQCFECEYYK